MSWRCTCVHINEKSRSKVAKCMYTSKQDKQTHRHTDRCDWTYYHAALKVVVVQVVGRDVSWGDCGRLAVTAWMWRAAVDCSRHEPQQPVKFGHRRFITAYDGWLAMTTRWNVVDIVPRNPPAHKVHQQDTTVLLPADTCRQVQQACSQSSQPPSTNEVCEGAEWWGRTSTTGKPAGQRSSLPTGDAWAGTAEYRQGLHFRNPAVTKRETLPATGIRLVD